MGVTVNGLLPPALESLRSSGQRIGSKTPAFQEGGSDNKHSRHDGEVTKSPGRLMYAVIRQDQACTAGV